MYICTSNNREPYIDTYTQCIRDWESEARLLYITLQCISSTFTVLQHCTILYKAM